jgi:hypothetical protein
MARTLVVVACLAAVVLLLAGGADGGSPAPAQTQDKAKVKNQMVTGTIKSVDVEKNVLVVSQKVKTEKVDRELSITEDVEFEVGGQSASGVKGLELLKDRIGANVKVKCDKDVNVLKVTVK